MSVDEQAKRDQDRENWRLAAILFVVDEVARDGRRPRRLRAGPSYERHRFVVPGQSFGADHVTEEPARSCDQDLHGSIPATAQLGRFEPIGGAQFELRER
jgi:hypothetical protein